MKLRRRRRPVAVGDRVRITVDCAGWDDTHNFKVSQGSIGTVKLPALLTGMWAIELDDGRGYVALGPGQFTVIG